MPAVAAPVTADCAVVTGVVVAVPSGAVGVAVAVDGASAQSLAPLVPAQLLAAAMGALQARLAHLHEALASVFAGLEGGEGAAAVAVADDAEGSESGGGGSGFSADMEAVLADALQVRRAQAAFHCCGGR